MTDEAADRVTAALAEALTAGELGECERGMPYHWVLIGTFLDEEGDTRTVFLSNEGARVHETLGLLALGTEAVKVQAERWIRSDE